MADQSMIYLRDSNMFGLTLFVCHGAFVHDWTSVIVCPNPRLRHCRQVVKAAAITADLKYTIDKEYELQKLGLAVGTKVRFVEALVVH